MSFYLMSFILRLSYFFHFSFSNVAAVVALLLSFFFRLRSRLACVAVCICLLRGELAIVQNALSNKTIYVPLTATMPLFHRLLTALFFHFSIYFIFFSLASHPFFVFFFYFSVFFSKWSFKIEEKKNRRGFHFWT